MSDTAVTVVEAITSRHSVRSFLDPSAPRGSIEHLLDLARYAPSGTNTQPWHVYVLGGDVKKDLSARPRSPITMAV